MLEYYNSAEAWWSSSTGTQSSHQFWIYEWNNLRCYPRNVSQRQFHHASRLCLAKCAWALCRGIRSGVYWRRPMLHFQFTKLTGNVHGRVSFPLFGTLCVRFKRIFWFRMAPELMIIRDTPNASLWTLEEGYKDPEQNESYPRRICDAKPSSALVFILCLNDRIKEYVCDDRIPGFRFYLHMPGEGF